NVIGDTVSMPSGSVITYTVTGNVPSSTTGSISNTATVTPPSGVNDPTPANNTATDTDTAALNADLRITKTDGSATYTPGGSITYTIVVTNAGPSDVTGATVADTIPVLTGVTWTAVATTGTPTGFTASGTGNAIGDTVS